jgi:hypothetical protein
MLEVFHERKCGVLAIVSADHHADVTEVLQFHRLRAAETIGRLCGIRFQELNVYGWQVQSRVPTARVRAVHAGKRFELAAVRRPCATRSKLETAYISHSRTIAHASSISGDPIF